MQQGAPEIGEDLELFTKRRVVWGLGIGLAALALLLIAIPMFNLFHAHQHRIKGTFPGAHLDWQIVTEQQ